MWLITILNMIKFNLVQYGYINSPVLNKFQCINWETSSLCNVFGTFSFFFNLLCTFIYFQKILMYFYTTLDMFLPVKMLYFSTRASRVPIGPDPPTTIISLVLKEKKEIITITRYVSLYISCLKNRKIILYLNYKIFPNISVDSVLVCVLYMWQ